MPRDDISTSRERCQEEAAVGYDEHVMTLVSTYRLRKTLTSVYMPRHDVSMSHDGCHDEAALQYKYVVTLVSTTPSPQALTPMYMPRHDVSNSGGTNNLVQRRSQSLGHVRSVKGHGTTLRQHDDRKDE
ncbi:hypothetical protein B0H34DRAFT_800170 [Crassisporium funariophilum]|nr:hypothetical protein B0H34DRAFT_800170 [Crassisporium funariophilum]